MRPVEPDALAHRAAQQLVDRDAERLRLDVEERVLDRADRLLDHAAARLAAERVHAARRAPRRRAGPCRRARAPGAGSAAVTPVPPKDSLYSLQPTSPSSVVILRKSKLRWPASACRVSRLSIRIALSPRAPAGWFGPCLRAGGRASILRSMDAQASGRQTIRTMCPMNCHPTLCGMLATVEDGRLLERAGRPRQPRQPRVPVRPGPGVARDHRQSPPAAPAAGPLAPGRGRVAARELGRRARPRRRPDARGGAGGGRALVGARALREQLRHPGRLAPAPPLREPLGLPVVAPVDDLLGARRLRPGADGGPRGEHEGGHGRTHARLIVLWGANLASQPNTAPAPGRGAPPRRPRRHDRRARDGGVRRSPTRRS